jgi:hypothetical protein
MRLSQLFSGIAVSCAIVIAAPAWAASDYLLQLEGVKGEAAAGSPPATVEVLSWSWGASNPSTIGSGGMSAGKVSVQDLSMTKATPAAAAGSGGGAGKVNVQDLSMTSSAVVTAREAGSGMATGKTVAPGAVTDIVSTAPAAGSVSELTVRFRESPTRASTGRTTCAVGKHFDTVTLRGSGQSVTLQDATVTSCGGQGADRTMTVKGKTGHVTLMK